MEAVLTIAGSDSGGGAGIQADLKTIAAHHLFGMSVVTALTAQNTTGVFGIEEVDPAFVAQQIDVVFDDIRPAAVKIGMVSSPDIAAAVAQALVRHEAQHVVIDPVMVATSGAALIADESVEALVACLLPIAEVVTPNLAEAQVLSEMRIEDAADMERAAEVIAGRIEEAHGDSSASPGAAVLVKGGHADELAGTASEDSADDLLRLPDGSTTWLHGTRVDTANTHGTGCTLSSAVACGLARGSSVCEAVRSAKAYVSGALAAGLDLGHGSGPLDHMWMLDEWDANP